MNIHPYSQYVIRIPGLNDIGTIASGYRIGSLLAKDMQVEVVRELPKDIARDVQADGTLRCHRCGNNIPPSTDPDDLRVGIFWKHKGIRCQHTEGEMSR